MNRKAGQIGMTLIEIMVALLIGAFLLGGVLQTFTGSKQTNRLLEELGRIQENGRFALSVLANDIRMARYVGCQNLRNLNLGTTLKIDPAVPFALSANTALSGLDNVSDNWGAACGADNKCAPGSDVITVAFAERCGNLAANMADANSAINVQNATDDCGFSSFSAFLVANCSNVDVFKSTNEAFPVQHPALGAVYQTDAELFRFRPYTYFIKEASSGVGNSLWRLDNSRDVPNGNPVELVEGVDDMQILYGEDTDATPDGTANYYVPAGQIANMSGVVSVRISLLIRSQQAVASQTVTYIYNGDTQQRNDGFLRRVFNGTIAIRNRNRL